MAQCPKHKDRATEDGKTRCTECLTVLREYQRKRREERRTLNRCVGTVTRSDCQNTPRPGKTMCEACAVIFNDYQLVRIAERRKEKV
jgi:hypothetical protein